jgi:hypothetical protein
MPTAPIMIANDFTTPFVETSNLNTINAFSDGSSWNNKWGKIVVWIIANKTGEPDFLLVNTPRSGYTSSADALLDESQTADYSIPIQYKSKAVLLGAFAINLSAGTLNYSGGYQDLRGTIPSNIAGGGGGGGGVTSYLALSDTPSSFVGQAGKQPVVNSGETALEFRLNGGASPFDYGGVGDGVTDDSVSVQACYDANTNVNLDGGAWLCGGITMQDKTTTSGGSVIGLTGATIIFNLSARSEIKGVKFTTTGTQTAIVRDQSLLTVTDIDDAWFSVHHCEFFECFNGVSVIDSTGMAGGSISDNRFYGVENNGILLFENAEYVICANNVFSECKRMFYVKGGNVNINGVSGTGSTVAENLYPWSNVSEGIYIAQGLNDVHGTITGININHCKKWGLYSEDVSNRSMQISTGNFIDSPIELGVVAFTIENIRFTTSSFTFNGTLGTRFSNCTLDATPTISYVGAVPFNVVWDNPQTTTGTIPTMPPQAVENGGLSFEGGELPLVTGVDMDKAGCFNGYVVSPVNAPASGIFWCDKVTDDIQTQVFKPFNSSTRQSRDRNSSASWTAWV